MIIFISTKQFDKTYEGLNAGDRERIAEKLQYLKSHPQIFTVVKKIENLDPATHRVRIGNYRILLKIDQENTDKTTFILLKLGHRREIYK